VGWTNLVSHLSRLGVGDTEMLDAGLATTTRTGRVIDRFRDRLTFPITQPSRTGPELLGFVGRLNPHLDDQVGGPKYLNTPETVLFHKGAQLYAVHAELLDDTAIPVLVEGVMDALAVSVAGGDRYVGVAPLGTALTEGQARQLASIAHEKRVTPIVATDADLAGQAAAQRDYWLLAQHSVDPRTVALRPGSDPADLLATQGPLALRSALAEASPLADLLIRERLTSLPGVTALRESATVLAASDPGSWDTGSARIADATGVPVRAVRRELARAVRRWDRDQHGVATEQVADMSTIRDRLTARYHTDPPATDRSSRQEPEPSTQRPSHDLNLPR
jgi:DNA primase catalytic core